MGERRIPPPGSITTKLPSGGATAMAASGEPGRCSPGPGTAGDDRDDARSGERREGGDPRERDHTHRGAMVSVARDGDHVRRVMLSRAMREM